MENCPPTQQNLEPKESIENIISTRHAETAQPQASTEQTSAVHIAITPRLSGGYRCLVTGPKPTDEPVLRHGSLEYIDSVIQAWDRPSISVTTQYYSASAQFNAHYRAEYAKAQQALSAQATANQSKSLA